jgi:hypothetical protein
VLHIYLRTKQILLRNPLYVFDNLEKN